MAPPPDASHRGKGRAMIAVVSDLGGSRTKLKGTMTVCPVRRVCNPNAFQVLCSSWGPDLEP
jgi:hypothetical protein